MATLLCLLLDLSQNARVASIFSLKPRLTLGQGAGPNLLESRWAGRFLRHVDNSVITGENDRAKETDSIMTIHLHKGDLPNATPKGDAVAIDTETMGLQPHRDRLCVVQLSWGDGSAEIVQIEPGQSAAPNLTRLLADCNVTKLFHFARFDIAAMANAFGVYASPVYCTKIASKLARTYTDRHGLKDLVRELLGVELSKQQQSSDWGAPVLTEAQMAYAASDVLHLHALRARLDPMLKREGRMEVANACFEFLPARAKLDLKGWPEHDIFSHA